VHVKTSIRLLLTALLISGVTWAAAGTLPPQTSSPQAASLALNEQ
jgi:hypothetical protein